MSEYVPFKDKELPEEIEVDGKVYLNKEQLVNLIRSEKKKFFKGEEKGYLCSDAGQRTAAMISLNRLQAILLREEAAKRIKEIMEGE